MNDTQQNDGFQILNFFSLFCCHCLEICILFKLISLQFIHQKNAPKSELLTNVNCILTEAFSVIQWNLVTIFHFPTQVTKIIFLCLAFYALLFKIFFLPHLYFLHFKKAKGKEGEMYKCKIFCGSFLAKVCNKLFICCI